MKIEELKKKAIQDLSTLYNEREGIQIVNRLLEEYLGKSRVELVLDSSDLVAAGDLEKIEQALLDLRSGKPIDYIIGKTTFFGRDFIVDERVLIPRPETEELVQYILEREEEKSISILDIGTGSGCIPISLKMEGGYHHVEACEYSKDALENAKENNIKLEAGIELYQMDILNEVPSGEYDVIVSNPPYVFKEELESLDKNVVEFEPLMALAPEGESLQFYKRILALIPRILKNGGRIYFEIHEDMGEEIEVLMRHHGLQEVQVVEDMYGRDRIASGFYTN